MKLTRENLISIYQHTKQVCSSFEIPKSEKLSSIRANYSAKSLKGEIIIEPMDTVSALTKYVADGKVAVLNMANAKNKGGGVERGSMAQEECLFRCSNLFQIPDEFYPMATNELIYSHQVTFIKSADYEVLWPMEADVITIAAPNLNKQHFNGKNKDMYDTELESPEKYNEVMSDKIDSMLAIAALNGCTTIILGAWGCGAFKNDPTVVSKLFRAALESKRYLFEKVVFAIINDKNSVGNNFQIFEDEFKGL